MTAMAWHGVVASVLALPAAAGVLELHRRHRVALAACREAASLLRRARIALALAEAVRTRLHLELAHAERQGVACLSWPEEPPRD